MLASEENKNCLCNSLIGGVNVSIAVYIRRLKEVT